METSPDRSFPIIVGCESCVEAMPLIGGGNANAVSADEHRKMRIATKVRRVEKTEYPPLIPLLARTESLHSRMPWVLRRYCTSDGRLVLREERVRHHEYLRAHRSGGRLTLHLVHLEDNGFDLPIVVDPDDDKNSVWNSYLDSKDDISHEKNRKMMIIRNISSCQRAKQRWAAEALVVEVNGSVCTRQWALDRLVYLKCLYIL